MPIRRPHDTVTTRYPRATIEPVAGSVHRRRRGIARSTRNTNMITLMTAAMPPITISGMVRARNPTTISTIPTRSTANCIVAFRSGRTDAPIIAGNNWYIAPIAVSVPHPSVARWFTARTCHARKFPPARLGAAQAAPAPSSGNSKTAVAMNGIAGVIPGRSASRAATDEGSAGFRARSTLCGSRSGPTPCGRAG